MSYPNGPNIDCPKCDGRGWFWSKVSEFFPQWCYGCTGKIGNKHS